VNLSCARSSLLRLLILCVLLAGCGADDPTQPHVEFLGGGFIFNYRLAETDYGFVVKPLRTLPPDTQLVALFEDPAGGPPFAVSQPTRRGMLQYVFRSPPVHGVVAGRDYRVELRLVELQTGRVIASYERNFRSDVDQAVLPDRSPVIGPGHPPEPAVESDDTAR